MIKRNNFLNRLQTAISRSPITALLGPRQCGKTTLARYFGEKQSADYYDLESQVDLRRLQNPELILGIAKGLVILDEIQLLPQLFSVLRVIVDRPESKSKFLILGSASPYIIKNASESLAGRVEFIELTGFNALETDVSALSDLWSKGGYPRSFLAKTDNDSYVWRDGFIRTFLERDIPQLGISIPAQAMRRFWTMLAHFHGQIWNASKVARSMGVTDKTTRSYLDILSGTYMIRQLQPWFQNISKRQVKAPKIYFRDTGLLHSLLGMTNMHNLIGHPQVGASWEGFVIEQTLAIFEPSACYFWNTYSGAELDLFFIHDGKRIGIEIKFSEAPKVTKSMKVAKQELDLDCLFVIYPGKHEYQVDKNITVWPLSKLTDLPKHLS